MSATARLPEERTAIWWGPKKLAPVPIPSANAEAPLPAKVVTANDAVLARILCPTFSDQKYIDRAGEKTRPEGKFNVADVPTPLLDPATPLVPTTTKDVKDAVLTIFKTLFP